MPAENSAIRADEPGSSESTHRRRLAGQPGQHGGIRARSLLVGCDDHGPRVGYATAAQLGEPGIGGLQDRRNPLAVRVEDRSPRPCRVFDVQRFAEPGRVLLACAGAPPRFAGVGQKHHRPDHAVGQRLCIAVGVVGLRAHQSIALGGIGDERDRGVVAAERCAGERNAPRRVVERFADRLAPAPGVAAVVDLVEHHQRAAVLGAYPVPGRVACHLCVGDHNAVILRRRVSGGIAEFRIECDACACACQRPLRLEMFRGHDDGNLLDDAVGQQLGGNTQGKRRLTRTRRRDGEKIPRLGGKIPHQCPTLPAP